MVVGVPLLILMQVKGIFGASVLCLHKPLNLVKAVVIDDLHCLFLGVTKHLITLWFGDKYRAFDFYIGEKVGKINGCIILCYIL